MMSVPRMCACGGRKEGVCQSAYAIVVGFGRFQLRAHEHIRSVKPHSKMIIVDMVCVHTSPQKAQRCARRPLRRRAPSH